MLTVHLLGRLSIRCDGGDVSGLESRKVQELFCYILLHRQQPHPRERLASILWSNTSTAQSRANLRKTLWQLQSAFAGFTAEPPIIVEPEWIELNSAVEICLDVAKIETAYQQVCGAAGDMMSDGCAQQVECAIGLYRDDLLEGWYQDWCLFERERVQNIYLALLDKLMAYYERHQQFELALAHGTTILRYDRARELTHRHLMRLLVLSGDRTGALRQYERCVSIMHEELDTEPSEPTIALFQQIKANRPLANPDLATDELLLAQSRIETLLPRLCELQREGAVIWDEMKENIRAIEHILNGRLR